MRNLNKKQKNIIKKWVDENWQGAGSIYSYEQMPIELLDKLEAINDHETIWQNIQRFINDLAMEKVSPSVTKNDQQRYKQIEQQYLRSARAALAEPTSYAS